LTAGSSGAGCQGHTACQTCPATKPRAYGSQSAGWFCCSSPAVNGSCPGNDECCAAPGLDEGCQGRQAC
jgi:hypothetical protein